MFLEERGLEPQKFAIFWLAKKPWPGSTWRYFLRKCLIGLWWRGPRRDAPDKFSKQQEMKLLGWEGTLSDFLTPDFPGWSWKDVGPETKDKGSWNLGSVVQKMAVYSWDVQRLVTRKKYQGKNTSSDVNSKRIVKETILKPALQF